MKSIATSFSTSQVTVGATATQIVASRSGRDTVTVENTGTTDVYLGNSGVLVTSGILLPGVVGASVSIETTDAIYGVVASGTQKVCVIENF